MSNCAAITLGLIDGGFVLSGSALLALIRDAILLFELFGLEEISLFAESNFPKLLFCWLSLPRRSRLYWTSSIAIMVAFSTPLASSLARERFLLSVCRVDLASSIRPA